MDLFKYHSKDLASNLSELQQKASSLTSDKKKEKRNDLISVLLWSLHADTVWQNTDTWVCSVLILCSQQKNLHVLFYWLQMFSSRYWQSMHTRWLFVLLWLWPHPAPKTQDAVARTCLCRSHDVSKHLKWMQKARIFYDEWRRKYHLCARSSCWSPDLTCSRRCCSQSYRILEAPGSWLWKKKKRRKLGKVEKTLKEKETLREREAMVNVNHRNWRRPEHLENWQNRAEQLLTSQHQEVQGQHCRFPVGQKGWLSLQKYPAIKTEKVFTATVWKKKLKKSCSQSFVLLKTILEPGSVFPAPTLAAHWRLAPSLQEEGNGEGEWWCGG